MRSARDFRSAALFALAALALFLAESIARAEGPAPLLQLARSTAHTRGWRAGEDLRDARPAHKSHTFELAAAALRGNYDAIEGDVRLQPTWGLRSKLPFFRDRLTVRMGHDLVGDRGMTLADHATLMAASGRFAKYDFKQASQVRAAAPMLHASGIPEDRLMINVDVDTGRDRPLLRRAWNAALGVSASPRELERIRAELPSAWLSLSTSVPKRGGYSPDQIAHLATVADRLGNDKVSFPMRADLVDRSLVATLAGHGRVSVWNDPKTYDPLDHYPTMDAARAAFRAMGVDGVIDLRTRHVSR